MIFNFRRPLPPGFEWREQGDQLSIVCGDAVVLTVSQARGGWLIEIHLGANGGPNEIVAISKLRAVGWANRWVTDRAMLLVKLCEGEAERASPSSPKPFGFSACKA